MTEDIFQTTLSQFKHREPFQPFVIELANGGKVEVDDPNALVFNGAAGGFLSPTYDLVSFSCQDVRSVRAATQGASS